MRKAYRTGMTTTAAAAKIEVGFSFAVYGNNYTD